ncbi:hypothetical protein ACHAXR_011301 [Thalassiosira sp. AJA248-18]
MATQVSITLPGGPLGVLIQRSTSGQCFIHSKTNAASPLFAGDIILNMNGIVLADVEGGVGAWSKLFQAFASMPRNLVVLRSPPPSAADAAVPALPVSTKEKAAKANAAAQALSIGAVRETWDGVNDGNNKLPTANPPTAKSIAQKALELAKTTKPSEATDAAYTKFLQERKVASVMPTKPPPSYLPAGPQKSTDGLLRSHPPEQEETCIETIQSREYNKDHDAKEGENRQRLAAIQPREYNKDEEAKQDENHQRLVA